MANKPILIQVHGVILENNQVLFLKVNDEKGMHFAYPGTTLREGQSLQDALKASIMNQINCSVDIGRLLTIWEYLPEKENFRFGDRHRITFLFLCVLKPGSVPQMPRTVDPDQIDVIWQPLKSLHEMPVLPVLGEDLLRSLESRHATGNLFSPTAF